jgi:hypothetical protein
MQTFLPFADFDQSAKVLDRQRLGKQRVENLQILKALTQPDYGWKNHPAVKMWQGHVISLLGYQTSICQEWTSRGYKDTCLEKSFALVDAYEGELRMVTPYWVGDEEFHLSHQSNLLRKFPEYYGEFFPGVDPNLEYVWPSNH